MNLVISAFTMGLILALLSLGTLISFRMIRFTDITVDGSITLGAAISAVMLMQGHAPLTALFASLAGGALAGTVTGLLHTRFKIPQILSGILVMTALYSVNLRVMGRSNIPLLDVSTLSDPVEKGLFALTDASRILLWGWQIPLKDIAVFLTSLGLCAGVGFLLWRFLLTHFGTALRAAGHNPQMVKAQGVNSHTMVILSLALSNALVALSGSLLAQYQGFGDVQMGIGMMVWGLASIIIGEALVRRGGLGVAITGVILGTILFRLLIAIALRWGMNPNDLKLVTALFVFLALVAPHGAEKILTFFRGGKKRA
jgi:putative ABC transport system permease protein